MDWPEWWEWEIEVSTHVELRMEQRDFTEIELRRMLDVATGFDPDVLDGRWAIRTKHRRRPWEVIVEPDTLRRILAVITAYELT
jgi:hypothetical protein